VVRLADCGQVTRVQRQPYQAYPQYLIHTGDHPFDEVDALAADVYSLLKDHNERFETEEELRTWLGAAGIEHTEKDLEAALHQLERSGRLWRPRQDQWRSDSPLPGYFVPPRIRNE
jgi:hypothetical protein